MSLMTIKLNKAEGASWGFRLQGGKDFATPLCIQKVNGGSVASNAGLQAGDAIVKIGGKDALSLRHKEAQEAILKAGNSFELVVQRGAQTWKPSVTPLAEVKTTPDGVPVVTSTSLAANKQIVNAQYNTPLNLYSEENIAETLSAQAEVIGKGCLGINFKKYQRETVIQVNSPTYKLIHGDLDDTPKKPRPPPASPFDKANQPPPPVASFQRVKAPMPPTPQAPAAAPAKAAPAPAPQPPKEGGDSDSPLPGGPGPAGTRSVRAPETKAKPNGVPGVSQLTRCSECERPIT